ncbi:hypothetical protein J4732_15130 [Serratia marcescens]|uniref:Uncharacterized protein n=1 Tax=Serratia marcescens TaxID=615 RepID=A0A939NQ51_SERMA|nr:hypothetical protein [Serratia marcescens]
MPRLMLAWMNTYAVRFNTAEIPVGDSASEFLRMLGKTPNGEKQRLHDLPQAGSGLVGLSDHPRLQRQRTRAHLRRKAHQAFRGVDRFNRGTAPLWPGSVTFSDDYYQTLKSHAVPLDLRAFMELKGSALAMDVYTC